MKIENMLPRFSCISFLFKPPRFNQVYSLIGHLYPRTFSNNSFKTRFAIGFRGTTMWIKCLTEGEKSYTSIAVFKNMIKEKILNFSNEFLLF